MKRLAPVIGIDREKCINCHACIAACPVKFCVDGSGDVLLINHNMCIACGHCIVICTHKARHPIDDTDRFFDALKRREKIVAVVAPAAASVFPDAYLNLNGYLKQLGVEAFFDVSFGAELTVISYIDHINSKKPKLLIAQPCPAIVNFIEIYHPQLIPYLAPADSPILHNIKMIKEFYPKYRDHKIAVISPCLAKKREFDDTMGDYNVTMLSLKNLLKRENLDLLSFDAVAYTGPSAERAVSFPAPGGLLDTLERFIPGVRRDTRKIEGPHTIYHYLESVSAILKTPGAEFPQIIDCLNCEMGCMGGPGTGNDTKPLDELEAPIRRRSRELEKQLNPKQKERLYKKYHKLLKKYWKPGLYDRSYNDASANYTIREPSQNDLAEVYKSLKKTSEKDLYDCTACGYGSCRKMATAIHNKLNKPENCAHYSIALLDEERKTIMYINLQFKKHIDNAILKIERINSLVAKVDNSINTQSQSVEESAAVTGKIISSLKGTSDLSRQKREDVMGLIDNAGKGEQAMKETILAVNDIARSVDGIAAAIKIISVIASNTNLLAMNAAIEAAHAGEAGKGFAVVSDEIRRLSESTRENSRSIAKTLSSIISGINTTSKRTGDTGDLISEMSVEINGFAGTMSSFIDTLTALSAESSEITRSLETLRTQSSLVKNDYSEMMSLTGILRYEINYLASMSVNIVRAIEENDKTIVARLMKMEEEHVKKIQEMEAKSKRKT